MIFPDQKYHVNRPYLGYYPLDQPVRSDDDIQREVLSQLALPPQPWVSLLVCEQPLPTLCMRGRGRDRRKF